MNARVERLRAKLEEPLLVSDPVNVRYLSGLDSSNAALLVEPERVRLFTDFRYAASARAVEGVEFVETKRDLFQSLADGLSGRIGFEATSVTYERYSRLHAGGIDLVATYGAVEELRALKDDGELEALRRASEITSEAFDQFAPGGLHRPDGARAGLAHGAAAARDRRRGDVLFDSGCGRAQQREAPHHSG